MQGWGEKSVHDPRELPRVMASWTQCIATAQPFDQAFPLRRKDGVFRWFLTRVTPIFDAAGKLARWVGINTDIDDERRAKEAVKVMNEEVERRVLERTAQLTAANEELGAFSYSVAHDLRAPLRGMNGFAQVLLDDYKDKLDADGLDCLHEIHTNAQKMGQLIDGLLSLSRLTRSEMKRERVDLTSLAKAIVRDLATAEPERAVDVVVEPGLNAFLDPTLARALFENLLGNAWKFTKRVTTARVELGQRDEGQERVFFV